MSFTDKINSDIKQAMLAKDKDRLAVLRDIKAKLLLEATSGSSDIVSDETAIKICVKLHKQRMETYEIYQSQGRADLASDELFQAKVLEEYLPKMLSEDEIRIEVQDTITSLGLSGPQAMGKVMGVLAGKLAGKADGKIIAEIVKKTLSQ